MTAFIITHGLGGSGSQLEAFGLLGGSGGGGGGSAPTISSYTPTAHKLFLGCRQTIVVTGANFTGGTLSFSSTTGLTINSQAVLDSTHITADVSTSLVAGVSSRNIIITTPNGSASTAVTIADPTAATGGGISKARLHS